MTACRASGCIATLLVLLCTGCQNSDAKIKLGDHPDRGYRISSTPIERVVMWRYSDSPGAHLHIYLDRREATTGGKLSGAYEIAEITREQAEQVAKTGHAVFVFDAGQSHLNSQRFSRAWHGRHASEVAFEAPVGQETPEITPF